MNLLAATCVTNELKICSKRTVKYLGRIAGLPHRLELVAVKNGVTYIDDSKSTSAQSLKVALESYTEKNIILIAGGSDKGDTFDHLRPLF
jgi:UDP-N-acetylmuramoylalanine--D-glutamate ligase